MPVGALAGTWLAQPPHPIVSPQGLSLRNPRAAYHSIIVAVRLRAPRDALCSSVQIGTGTAMLALEAISDTRNTPIPLFRNTLCWLEGQILAEHTQPFQVVSPNAITLSTYARQHPTHNHRSTPSYAAPCMVHSYGGRVVNCL